MVLGIKGREYLNFLFPMLVEFFILKTNLRMIICNASV